jgi:hypothetical protein
MITVAQRPGRLGNLLLQYINLIAFAEEHNTTLCNPAFFDYNHYFVGTHRDILSRYPSLRSINLPHPFRVLIYRSLRLADGLGILSRIPKSTTIDLPADSDYHLDSPDFLSIFQSSAQIFLRRTWRSIYRSKSQLHLQKAREFFQLVPHRQKRIDNFVAQAKAQADITVGVHIRQTDFLHHRGGQYFFTSAEYASIMAKTAALFPGQRLAFIICSDSPQSPADFPNLQTHFPEPEHVEDLFTLAACDYIIGPLVSSYSMLASVLGDKKRYAIQSSADRPALGDFQQTLLS